MENENDVLEYYVCGKTYKWNKDKRTFEVKQPTMIFYDIG